MVTAIPARTAAEATAARNGTLAPEWFRAAERVETLFQRLGDDDRLLNGSLTVIHREELSGRTPAAPERGWILLRYETAWYGFVDRGADLTVGREYAAVLDANWTLEFVVPSEWETTELGGDPIVSPAGQTGTVYEWSLGDAVPAVFVVVDSPLTPRPPRRRRSPPGTSRPP